MKTVLATYSEKVVENNKDVIAFSGLNRLPLAEKGELSAMTNIYSMYPGCLTPRPSRSVAHTLTAGHALFATSNFKLCWVDGTSFFYDGVSRGTVTAGPKSMVDFYGTILIFPDKKYYNYLTNTWGDIGNGSPADGEAPAGNQCPNMDMVCIFNNRVWGIKNKTVYGSKFGDPFNWSQFSVPIQEDDAVYFKISAERGNLTGILPLENHIIFTSQSSFHELFGVRPSNFTPQLVSNSKGCIDGKSLVEVDTAAFMLSQDGINIYSGSSPRPISIKLDEKYVSGKAGTDGRRYYISLFNGVSYNLYVYDTDRYFDNWYREDGLNVKDFAVVNGALYALASDNKVYRFNHGTENVSWEAETERFTERYSGKKTTSKIRIRAELEDESTLDVFIKTGNGEYELIQSFNAAGYRSVVCNVEQKRVDHFQIKLTGTGFAKIYEIERTIIFGSDVDESNAFGGQKNWYIYSVYTWDDMTAFTWNDLM